MQPTSCRILPEAGCESSQDVAIRLEPHHLAAHSLELDLLWLRLHLSPAGKYLLRIGAMLGQPPARRSLVQVAVAPGQRDRDCALALPDRLPDTRVQTSRRSAFCHHPAFAQQSSANSRMFLAVAIVRSSAQIAIRLGPVRPDAGQLVECNFGEMHRIVLASVNVSQNDRRQAAAHVSIVAEPVGDGSADLIERGGHHHHDLRRIDAVGRKEVEHDTSHLETEPKAS
jgi:hypothetical protein